MRLSSFKSLFALGAPQGAHRRIGSATLVRPSRRRPARRLSVESLEGRRVLAVLSINDVTQAESLEDYDFTISLSDPIAEQVCFDVRTDLDVVNLCIDAGQTEQHITVHIPDNDIVELDGSFEVTIENVTGGGGNVTLGKDVGAGTIFDDDFASLSIDDVQQSENLEDYVFTISLDRLVNIDVCFDVTTDLDSTTLCIPPLQLSTTVTINVPDNDTVEVDGFFDVTISNPDAFGLPVTIAKSVGEAAILDDDSATVSIDDVSLFEGLGGVSDYVFSVTLSHPVDTAVTVSVDTADDTATTADGDYLPVHRTITFLPGDPLVQTVAVQVVDDITVERDETFLVNLSNLDAGGLDVSILDDQGAGAIANNDRAGLRIENATAAEGTGVAPGVPFAVTLSNPVDFAVSFRVDSTDGSATTSDADYTTLGQTFTFNPGDPLTQLVVVQVTGDARVELDETLTVDLSGLNASGRNVAIDAAHAEGTIDDDDSATISIDDVDQAESLADYVFTVTLSNPVDFQACVEVTTELDVLSLCFDAGETTRTVTVNFPDNNIVETDGAFIVTLGVIDAGGRAVTLGKAVGDGTIRDDDSATLSVDDVDQSESLQDYVFTVGLSNPVSIDVYFDVTTDLDSTTLAIPAGELTTTFTVNVPDNDVVETDGFFQVTLGNVDALDLPVVIGKGVGEATIRDDDSATMSIDDATVGEGNSGVTNVVFNVTLDHPVDEAVTVEYRTVFTGTAQDESGDGDYTFVTGSITFDPLETSHTITIAVNGDLNVERDETFAVELSNVSAGGLPVTLAKSVGAVTIDDDDAARLSIDDVQQAESLEDYVFTVSLDHPVDIEVFFDVTTDLDVLRLSLAPGQTSRTVTVTLPDNDVVEGDGTFTVTLSNVDAGGLNVALDKATGTGTILDDDSATLSIGDVVQSESIEDYVFTVTLSNPVDVDVYFDVTTDLDSTTLFIPARELSTTFTVNVPNNDTVEDDGFFQVTISNVDAINLPVTILKGVGEATILDDDSATLSIDDVVQSESIEDYVFTVTLSNPVDVDVYFDVTTDLDSTTLFIPARQLSTTFTVNVPNNDTVEVDGFFQVTISNVDALNLPVTILKGVGEATIEDDDAAQASIDDVTMIESDDGLTSFVFTVTLDHAVDATVTIDYTTIVGTAENEPGDDDFHFQTDTVTFAPLETSRTITISVHGDDKVERDETFTIQLSNAFADGLPVSLDKLVGLGTIVNDDDATLDIVGATIVEGDAGTVDLVFTVTLSQPVDVDVQVEFATDDGSASSASGDYTPVAQSLTFFHGSPLSQTVVVHVTADNRGEIDETIEGILSSIAANGRDVAFGVSQAVGTILDDDDATVSVGDAMIAEGNAGTATLSFAVTLSGPVDAQVTVTLAASDGSATIADGDYSAPTPTLVFNPGDPLTKNVTVTVNSDLKVEVTESLTLNLVSVTAEGRDVSIGSGQGAGTITNDDSAAVTIADASVAEGAGGTSTLTFTLQLSNPVDTTVTVTAATSDNTATTADNDYVAASGSVAFAAGTTTQTFNVQINGDNKVEIGETLDVALSNLVLGVAGRDVTIGDPQAVGTIDNDDSATIVVNDVSVVEGNNGTANLVFTVTLSNPVDVPVSVLASTADGTATVANGDYTAIANQLVNFAVGGALTQNVTVSVAGDAAFESNETLTLNLSGLSAGTPLRSVTISDPQGTGTISSDDFNGVISGFAYSDTGTRTPNGARGTGEAGIPGVTITLTGTDDLNAAVTRTAMTDNNGAYTFSGLRPGTYSVEETQPSAMFDGAESAGTSGGSTATNNRIASISLLGNATSTGNNFGENGTRPQLVSIRSFLVSTPAVSAYLRETVARGEELAGNTAQAVAIRQAGITSTSSSAAAGSLTVAIPSGVPASASATGTAATNSPPTSQAAAALVAVIPPTSHVAASSPAASSQSASSQLAESSVSMVADSFSANSLAAASFAATPTANTSVDAFRASALGDSSRSSAPLALGTSSFASWAPTTSAAPSPTPLSPSGGYGLPTSDGSSKSRESETVEDGAIRGQTVAPSTSISMSDAATAAAGQKKTDGSLVDWILSDDELWDNVLSGETALDEDVLNMLLDALDAN